MKSQHRLLWILALSLFLLVATSPIPLAAQAEASTVVDKDRACGGDWCWDYRVVTHTTITPDGDRLYSFNGYGKFWHYVEDDLVLKETWRIHDTYLTLDAAKKVINDTYRETWENLDGTVCIYGFHLHQAANGITWVKKIDPCG